MELDSSDKILLVCAAVPILFLLYQLISAIITEAMMNYVVRKASKLKRGKRSKRMRNRRRKRKRK